MTGKNFSVDEILLNSGDAIEFCNSRHNNLLRELKSKKSKPNFIAKNGLRIIDYLHADCTLEDLLRIRGFEIRQEF